MEALTIIAIFLGPILAVQAQKWIERITREKEDKKRILVALLATRGRPLERDHVQALNLIDFYFQKDREVVEAWKEYRDHLNNAYPKEPEPKDGKKITESETATYQALWNAWLQKKDELLCNLLRKMSEAVGYHFDNVLLRKGAYVPKGYDDAELLDSWIKKSLLQTLLGTRSLPICITDEPPSDEETQKALKAILKGRKPFPVRIIDEDRKTTARKKTKKKTSSS